MLKIMGNELNITCKTADEQVKTNIAANILKIKINVYVAKVKSMAFLNASNI